MIVTRDEFDEMFSMVKEMYGYIFSDRFSPKKREVRMTSSELKDILNIPNTTFHAWLKKGNLPRRKDEHGYYFIASEINKALEDKIIIRDARYVEEFRRNYIDND